MGRDIQQLLNEAYDPVNKALRVNGPTTGTATLANGTTTVNTTAVDDDSCILLTRKAGAGTTRGVLAVGTIVAGTSFVIRSEDLTGTLSADDDSEISWAIPL